MFYVKQGNDIRKGINNHEMACGRIPCEQKETALGQAARQKQKLLVCRSRKCQSQFPHLIGKILVNNQAEGVKNELFFGITSWGRPWIPACAGMTKKREPGLK